MCVRHYNFITGSAILLLLFCVSVDAVGLTTNKVCLDEALSSADDSMTVGELRELCRQTNAEGASEAKELEVPVYERNVIEERFAIESEFEERPFVIGKVGLQLTDDLNMVARAQYRIPEDATSYELTWSFPISKVLRIYVQYYNGFGESMLDYDYDIERIGVGFAMNGFLGRY